MNLNDLTDTNRGMTLILATTIVCGIIGGLLIALLIEAVA
jgi:hypothetical protein